MKTKTKNPDNRVLIRIADKLVQAQQELDEMVLQFSLGKAEAKDKFEEIKSDFAGQIHEFSRSTTRQTIDSIRSELSRRVDELEQILKRGAVDSVEAFEKEKAAIDSALEQLKKSLNRRLPHSLDLYHFTHEIERFKLKLEILRLAFSLKKLEAKDAFRQKMQQIRNRVEQMASSVKEEVQRKKVSFSEFRKEAHEVYTHLRKAIEAL